jgi:hypothetical protein
MRSAGLSAVVHRGGFLIAWPLLVMAGYPAAAQMVAPPNLNGFQLNGAPNFGQPQTPQGGGAPARPPPSALPGAQPKAAPAPATTSPLTMNPTDELFDAINRGDLAAAQDAVTRGADLSGQNVLGMTPVQLSVDLGRNDITFLLLSAGGGEATPSPTSAGAQQLLGGKSGAKATRNAERRTAKVARVTVASPALMQTPRLFAGNGGSPIPSAGFLGFDQGR